MGIELPRCSKCCFCIPLKIGVLILGYVSIFASCLTLGTISYTIFRVSDYVKENNNKPNPEHPPNDVSKAALSLYISMGYYILVLLFSFTINLILVIGTHAGKPSYLRFYFKATSILFALSLILVVVTSVFMGYLATLSVLKMTVTLLVCMLMVRSYYLVLEEKEKPPVYEIQPYVPVQQGQQSQEAPLMA